MRCIQIVIAAILLQHPEIQKIDLTTVRGTRLRFPEANQAAPSFCPDSGTKPGAAARILRKIFPAAASCGYSGLSAAP